MTVRSIMTAKPLTLRADDTVARAAELMLGHRYLILPVVDTDNRCAGVFDMWDLLALLLPRAATLDHLVPDLGFLGDDLPNLQAKLKEIGGQPVGPLVRSDLPLLKPDMPVIEALLLLYRNRTTLPVVDADDCVIGVLSYWDALAAIASNPKDQEPSLEGLGLDIEDYAVVPRKQKSELEEFAAWFHQDWELTYPNFCEGARMYFDGLSDDRKGTLRKELSEFIARNAGLPSEEIKESWFKLGAQAWQPDLVILPVLKDFVSML